MADYAVSTNLISWIPAMHGLFGWPMDGREAEVIRRMSPGDVIVAKFAQDPVPEGQEPYQRGIAAVFEDDWEARRAQYHQIVNWGAGAVPFLMHVEQQLPDNPHFPSNDPWACVSVRVDWLEHPLSTSEFLRLRVVPVALAGQFKAMAAPNKHIQPLPKGAGAAITAAGALQRRGPQQLRRESLVRASDATEAERILRDAAMGPDYLDRAFLVTDGGIKGLYVANESGALQGTGEPIATAPTHLRDLLQGAQRKAVKSDGFSPARPLKAAAQLEEFLASDAAILPIDEFAHFHDRYVILPRKVTEALEIAARPEPETVPDLIEDVVDDASDDVAGLTLTLDQLQGLSVEAVQAALPPGMVVARTVIAEAVTAVRSGKHLIFSGPPGTGKSTIAAALSKAVVGESYRVATATADWTTFDTIGGYVPDTTGLRFEPGIVLRCLQSAEWLVIDELNRADIDKAFGPLFTLLAGSGSAQETVLLPYRHNESHVEIRWADPAETSDGDYVMTKVWRLLGTMNVTDKASLYQLSFAFLRRFAVIDVPLPDEADYRELLTDATAELPPGVHAPIVNAAIGIAFGDVQLGPAILLDIAAFTQRGLIKSSTGTAPYTEPLGAFLTAVRLYAVPQYEGAEPDQVARFTTILREALGEVPTDAWDALQASLQRVTLP